jgi:DNA invertase Pin-like site-specific DNA recombinase
MTPAIVYSRWSPRPNAEDCLSIETQLDRCRAFCQGNEYEIVQEYQEPNVSGDDCRPELEKAIGHAQRLRAVLVVYKLDRAARDTEDTLRIVRQLREAKADIASVTEQINTRGWMGKIFITLLGLFAEMEKERIRERTADAMQNHQAKGRRMGRMDRCPYGKMPDWNGPMLKKIDQQTGKEVSNLPARLIDNPDELAILKRIRQKSAEGLGARAIVTWLNDQAIPCRGQRWHLTTVRRLSKKAADPLTHHHPPAADSPPANGTLFGVNSV